MKITYLKLMNFATIFSAMKRKMIEIDFSKSKNRIILLVGDNGTGKTSILSQLHPFPYSGDIRSGPEEILENEDGYKEIHYDKDGDKYILKIHYLFKAGKGLKGFISKNGEELNQNGNITSFRELVHLELSIEQDYLKLLRLGSNVGGFLDMSATERKTFTSELLSDIDIYSILYKKINEDNRILNSILKSVASKIEKLRIYDEKQELEALEKLEEQLSSMRQARDVINSEIGKIKGAIDVLIPNGVDSFITEISLKERDYRNLRRNIEQLEDRLGKSNIIIIGDIDDEIESTKSEIRENESKISVNKQMVEFYFNRLNVLHTQKDEKSNELRYFTSSLEYSLMLDMHLELIRKKEEMSKKFKNFTPKCTREEMVRALGLMQEIDNITSNIFEYDATVIKKVAEHFLNNDNVEAIVRGKVGKIDNDINRINNELSTVNSALNLNPNAVYVLYQPPGCECDCPYRKFHEDVMGIKEDSPKQKLMSELKELEHRREVFLSYLDVSKKIDYILLIIKTNKDLIAKMPENFFDIKKILKSISEYTSFFDEDYVTNYIATLEEYEEYISLENKIKEVKRELSFIEKNSGSLLALQTEITSIDKEIYTVETEIEKLKGHNSRLEDSIELLNEALEALDEYKSDSNYIISLKSEADNLAKELNEASTINQKVQAFVDSMKGLESKLNSADMSIRGSESEINDTRFKLREFKSLSSEKELLESKQEDISIIRESLSSNKGIPLLFIKLYLKNTGIIVNGLLNAVYKGILEITDIIVNEKEFRIPYVKNGISVSDASRCSQGERSFISLALSFALIEQSIKDYNIMLLDEIDATLDEKKRADFIAILEKQLDTINAEQVFLITHNNMFDNYPVDIIKTSDVKIDNYKNTNIIFAAA